MSMRKFNVGERYKVNMNSLFEAGNTIEITDVNGSRVWYKTITVVDSRHAQCNNFDVGSEFSEKLIPIADENEEKVVITRKGNKTICKYYLNGKVMEERLARCCPEDTYDFATGARIAFDRMFESTFDWDAFVAGNIKKAVNRENINAFLKECDAHDLTWGHQKASEWNPFEQREKILEKAKVFGEFFKKILGVFDLPETIYILVVDGVLKFSDEDSFDWEKFKNHEIAVKVTPENVMDFLQEAEKNDCYWRNGDLPTETNMYERIINQVLMYLYGVSSYDDCGAFGYSVNEPKNLEIVEW